MLLHTLLEHWFKNAEFSTWKLIVYILFFILTIKLILKQSGICRHLSFFQFILIFILLQVDLFIFAAVYIWSSLMSGELSLGKLCCGAQRPLKKAHPTRSRTL